MQQYMNWVHNSSLPTWISVRNQAWLYIRNPMNLSDPFNRLKVRVTFIGIEMVFTRANTHM